MAAYATVADMRIRFDERDIAQLVSDTGAAVELADLNTDAVALEFLAEASGDVETALMAGGRYSVEDLAGLTGNSQAKLKRIVCALAMAYLLDRRSGFNRDDYESRIESAQKDLKKLQDGVNLFNLAEAVSASLPTLDAPTIAQREHPNLIPDRSTNYYPRVVLPGRVQ